MSIVNFTYPKFQSLDPVTGSPRVGYKLFTYAEGTSTKKTTWTDITKVAANTNPIILDSNGEASIWLDGNYKFVLAPPTDTDPPTSPVWTVDNIRTPIDPLTQQVTLNAPINGSFETDTNADGIPDNWSVSTYLGGSVLTDSTSSSHGAISLKFSSVGAGAGVASTTPYYEVEAGRKLAVEFSMISANANTENKVEVYWYNSTKTFISSTIAYHNTTTNPIVWTRTTYIASAPATAKYAQVVLSGVMPTSTVHSTTNFDDIIITPYVGSTNSVVNSDTTLTSDNTGTIFVSAAGGIVNITLPAASDGSLHYELVRTDTTTNAVNILRAGTDTIDGMTTYQLDVASPLRLVPDGVNTWYRFEESPVGSIQTFATATIPYGYLEANGAVISRTTYRRLFAKIGTVFGAGDGSTTFGIPDLRGQFVRGLDNGRGVDAARVFGSLQLDQMQLITGNSGLGAVVNTFTGVGAIQPNGAPPAPTGIGGGSTPLDTFKFDSSLSPGARTGTETRPTNVAMSLCIKY